MKILIIDDSINIHEQLKSISEMSKIPLVAIQEAWAKKDIQVTEATLVPPNILLDIKDLKPEVYKPEKKASYIAQQKQLPKFARNIR
jgi:hypothetical protein